jgi:hypothetical protein
MMDQTTLQQEISKHGQVDVGGDAFGQTAAALFGAPKGLDTPSTVTAQFLIADQVLPKSAIVTVGEAPQGFGKQVLWDPGDAALAVVAFINAADPFGVMISGVKPTDTIEFVSATGLASFAEDTENEGVSSFIGIVAAGANVAASAFNAQAAAPLINAAAQFAQEQFKENKVKTKRRDAFGQDPGSGLRARQEGGVLVSMPAAGQIFYSGNSDHRERWIKEPGIRDVAHMPNHIVGAFFLQSGHDRAESDSEGDIIVYAWDHVFDDNFGFYRLHFLLRRGDGIPDIIL